MIDIGNRKGSSIARGVVEVLVVTSTGVVR